MEYCFDFSVQTGKDVYAIILKTNNGTLWEYLQNHIETGVKY